MVVKGHHQSFLLSSKKSKEFAATCLELGVTKSEFLRELVLAYLDGRVSIENPKEHKFNVKEK